LEVAVVARRAARTREDERTVVLHWDIGCSLRSCGKEPVKELSPLSINSTLKAHSAD